MVVRICTDDDVIDLLECARNDDNVYKLGMFDDWAHYQKWLLDSVYDKHHQVLVVIDNTVVIGFLVWNLSVVYYKWLAYLDYIYVLPENRNSEASAKLVIQFCVNCNKSKADKMKFDTGVLPKRWVRFISRNAPLSTYTTYYSIRSEKWQQFINKIEVKE